MGCRCQERAAALRRTVYDIGRGDFREVAREVGFVGRTFREDARSGALARAALQRMTLLRGRR